MEREERDAGLEMPNLNKVMPSTIFPGRTLKYYGADLSLKFTVNNDIVTVNGDAMMKSLPVSFLPGKYFLRVLV